MKDKLEEPGFAQLNAKAGVTADVDVKPRDPNRTPMDEIRDRFQWIQDVIAGLERADQELEKGIRRYVEKHNEWTRRVDQGLAENKELLELLRTDLDRLRINELLDAELDAKEKGIDQQE